MRTLRRTPKITAASNATPETATTRWEKKLRESRSWIVIFSTGSSLTFAVLLLRLAGYITQTLLRTFNVFDGAVDIMIMGLFGVIMAALVREILIYSELRSQKPTDSKS